MPTAPRRQRLPTAVRIQQILDAALPLFEAPDGGFYDAVDTGLFDRPRSLTDNVTPSGTSALIAALRSVALLAERPDLAARADEAARTTWAVVAETPRFAGAALAQPAAIHSLRCEPDDRASSGLCRCGCSANP